MALRAIRAGTSPRRAKRILRHRPYTYTLSKTALIVANEVTRKLTEDVGRLVVQTNQRVTGLDQRVVDLESQ